MRNGSYLGFSFVASRALSNDPCVHPIVSFFLQRFSSFSTKQKKPRRVSRTQTHLPPSSLPSSSDDSQHQQIRENHGLFLDQGKATFKHISRSSQPILPNLRRSDVFRFADLALSSSSLFLSSQTVVSSPSGPNPPPPTTPTSLSQPSGSTVDSLSQGRRTWLGRSRNLRCFG